MNKLNPLILAIALCGLLVACGGGGGSSASNQAPATSPSSVTRLSGPPIAVQNASYLNFKNIGLTQKVIPLDGEPTARAWADYSRSGNLDIFVAEQTYDSSKPISQATPSIFLFGKVMSDGSYVEDTEKLTSNKGCIHPRKALVADFNGDSVPDVFVLCHGYDAGSYPGEVNKIVLSQPNGKFVIQDASSDIGFWHGGSAMDVNGDGKIDVLAVSGGNTIKTFINDGKGSFTLEADGRFPTFSTGGYYSLEAIDVDGDGYKDVLLGGHEMDGAKTLLLMNPQTNNFAAASQVIIPPVSNEGVVLDFVLTGSGSAKTIWVLRTGSGPTSFYVGKTVQKVSWPSNTSQIALQKDTGGWIPWLIPTIWNGQSYVSSDLVSGGVNIAY